jgi:hypothetical protein
MTEPIDKDLRETLLDYSRGRADDSRVLRALVEHEGWIVSTAILGSHYRRRDFPGVYVFGDRARLPTDRLWLFSEIGAALRAQGGGLELGVCAVNIAGTEIFGDLAPDWQEVFVNPGMPVEETFSLRPHREFGWLFCAKYAKAVEFEKAIDRIGATNPEEILPRIKSSKELFVVGMADDSLLTVHDPDGDETLAAVAVFTAPDRVEALVETLDDRSVMEGSRIFPIDGEQLLFMTGVDYGFMALNPGSQRASWTIRIGRPGSAGPDS